MRQSYSFTKLQQLYSFMINKVSDMCCIMFRYRLFIVLMCVVAILWVPMVKVFQSGRLFNYMVAVEGYIGSPLGVLFLLSIFSTKVTEQVIFAHFDFKF